MYYLCMENRKLYLAHKELMDKLKIFDIYSKNASTIYPMVDVAQREKFTNHISDIRDFTEEMLKLGEEIDTLLKEI